MPERLPDRMSEQISQRMPDTMSVGGDHSKKVIWLFFFLVAFPFHLSNVSISLFEQMAGALGSDELSCRYFRSMMSDLISMAIPGTGTYHI